jgi:hypothetical protein
LEQNQKIILGVYAMRSKFEIKAQKELEAEGWQVDWKVRPYRTPKGYAVDYFNCFDLMAYQEKVIRFIAIKGQGGVPDKLRQDIINLDFCDHIVKEIWTYRQPTKKGKRLKSVPYQIRKEIIE